MITKTRPSEAVTSVVKEESRLNWERIAKGAVQLAFAITTMIAAHSLYIFVWRTMTGH